MSELHDYRIGDEERQQAMDILGSHFTAGRLDTTEYNNRLTAITSATMKSELTQLFTDLPTTEETQMLPQYTPVITEETPVLSQYAPVISEEAVAAYKRGRNMRIGVVTLAVVSSPFIGAAVPALGSCMVLLSITLFVLLFIMRVGPETWFQPNPWKEYRRQIAQSCQVQKTQRRMLS